MKNYSPMGSLLIELKDNFTSLGYPVYFKLPGPEVEEPFIYIGDHTNVEAPDAWNKNGKLVESTALQVHLYLPGSWNTIDVTEATTKVREAIGRRDSVQSNKLKDDSIGREVHHVVFSITDKIY